MTSMPASRNARAITLAPRSCPSNPGFATTMRIGATAHRLLGALPGVLLRSRDVVRRWQDSQPDHRPGTSARTGPGEAADQPSTGDADAVTTPRPDRLASVAGPHPSIDDSRPPATTGRPAA